MVLIQLCCVSEEILKDYSAMGKREKGVWGGVGVGRGLGFLSSVPFWVFIFFEAFYYLSWVTNLEIVENW